MYGLYDMLYAVGAGILLGWTFREITYRRCTRTVWVPRRTQTVKVSARGRRDDEVRLTQVTSPPLSSRFGPFSIGEGTDRRGW